MTPWFKRTVFAALPLAGALCVAPVVSADYDDYRQSSRSDTEMNTRDLRSFESYLNNHWETAQQLYQDPDLLRDRRFIRNHESLDNWLDAHPDAAEALQANPHKYLWRDRASRSEHDNNRDVMARMTERDLRSLENFLDSNPETARRLYDNPELINDRQFVRNRSALHDWMENHPNAAQALRDDPQRFLWRERTTSAADFLQQLLGNK